MFKNSSSAFKSSLHKTIAGLSIVLFLFLSQGGTDAIAGEALSPNTLVELRSNEVTISELFKEIENQTDFMFVYSTLDVPLNKTVNVSKKKETVNALLSAALGSQGLTYEISNKYIVVSKASASSQQAKKSISGIVIDEKGNPVAGASVFEKGTTNGTTTDADGRFSLNVPAGVTITVSFMGYLDKTFVVSSSTNYSITLSEDTELLSEVVVVGYGTQKKSDLTGSIVSVKADAIKDIPATSITETLQGKVAGVMVNKSSGIAGSDSDIIVRGVGSINGLSPLYVIDGIPRGSGVTYNPKDIESIEVIKDASAAAIYGARAAGGVILITTKNGSFDEKPVINFNGSVGFNRITKQYDMLNTTDYIRARRALGTDYTVWSNPESLPDTDWFSELFHTGVSQNYDVSLRGGSSKLRYYLSADYDKDGGIELENSWSRISIRSNVDYKLAKNFTIGTRIYLARIGNKGYNTESMPWRTVPFMAVKDEDGTWGKYADISGVEFSGGNPVASKKAFHRDRARTSTASIDGYAIWNILPGLTFNVNASALNTSGYNDNLYIHDYTRRSADQSSYTKSTTNNESYDLNTTLTYENTFAEKHYLKAMAGYEVQRGTLYDLDATATNLAIDDVEDFALSTSTAKTADGGYTRNRYLSYFGRINYTFANRYVFTFNIRRDGSPKFGPNHRWGTFPSASAAWKIQEEPFFKNAGITWINQLKPRFSWGILGNDNALSSFMYSRSYEQTYIHSFDESTSTSGYSVRKVINKDIKWESIYNTDAGIDFALLNNRLSGSFDYYIRNTKDMIYNLPTPYSAGIGRSPWSESETMPTNIGKIENKGWEIVLSWRDDINDFHYGITANLSHNSNKVKKLGLTNASIYAGSTWSFDQYGGASPFKTVDGESIGKIWGLKTAGIFKSQEEIDKLNAQAVAKGGSYYQNKYTALGDLKFVDLNNDGTINNEDRTFIGNPWPKFNYGFTLNFGYKGFDLTANFVGVAKRDVLNLVKGFEHVFKEDFQTTSKIFDASYFLGNGLTDTPRVSGVNESGTVITDPNYNYDTVSDYFVEDGSYLKLNNLTLGYTLPENLTQKVKISNLRVYMTCHNMFTITKFSGLDPEFSGSKTAYGLYNHLQFPQAKIFSLGVDVTF